MTKLVSIEKCNDSSLNGETKVSFGDSSSDKVCWNSNKNVVATGEVNELLSSGGSQPKESGANLNISNGKTSCLKDRVIKGVLTGQGEGVEYLGKCDTDLETDQNNEALGIKKEQKNGEELKVGLCSEDCGEESGESPQSMGQTYSQPKMSNWSEITFRTVEQKQLDQQE